MKLLKMMIIAVVLCAVLAWFTISAVEYWCEECQPRL